MRKILYIGVSFVACVILLGGCGFGLLNMQQDSKKDNQQDSKKSMTEAYPEAIRVGNTSLILKTPFKLEVAKKQNLGKLEPYIKHIVGKIGNNEDICIIINGVSFDSKKIEMDTGEIFVPNLEGALKSGLENMKKTSMVKDLHINSIQNRKISGLNGKEINGYCTFNKKDNSDTLFHGIACYHGEDMLNVLVFYPKGDSSSEKIVEAVFDSIMVFRHNK